MDVAKICITIVILPIISALLTGIFGKYLKPKLSNAISVAGVLFSLVGSLYLLKNINNIKPSNIIWYDWMPVNVIGFQFGFLVDYLNIITLTMVATISLVIHIYSIFYLNKDPGITRFFSYISFFSAAMYSLILANNFLQLFLSWELVGLASYWLIGFWFNQESSNQAALQAFLINRIGDASLLLGIAIIFISCNSLNYLEVFNILSKQSDFNNLINLITICLLLGIITKSAQIPLHIWLPDSMTAPTPASALIHAATMVAAGIFLIARLAVIFEHSNYCLNLMLIIGSITAGLMSILAIIETDIKRILAYSTISQLGFMLVAMGVGAYSAGMFHLINHAFFKSLLFLGAGILIIASNNNNDINEMSQPKKLLPITYWTMLIASLSMAGVPGLSGYFSKSLIITALELKLAAANSNLLIIKSAYYLLLFSCWATAFYSLRLMFIVFHSRKPKITVAVCKETKVVAGSLIVLAVFTAILGILLINQLPNLALFNLSDIVKSANLYSIFGIICATVLYFQKPHLAKIFNKIIQEDFYWFYNCLTKKFYFKELAKTVAITVDLVAKFFAEIVEKLLLEKILINNSIKLLATSSKIVRKLHNGHLHHYLFIMLTGVLVIISWLFFNIY